MADPFSRRQKNTRLGHSVDGAVFNSRNNKALNGNFVDGASFICADKKRLKRKFQAKIKSGFQRMSIASPKEKNLYFSSTAMLYSSRIFSLPTMAATSIMSVLSGRWKLVMRQSTHLNL